MAEAQASGVTGEEKTVIFASSLGTVFEWYDFYLYGSLAASIAKNFFSALPATGAYIVALLAFSAGFIVRPFGALVFGRLGDMIGRKYTFLVTILIMGLSTFGVGLLPGYETIGVAAPIILLALRLLQGLALGGEYGGAATYVAEHAPMGKRGAYTSWIQTTATMGLFLSLLVILGCRTSMAPADFDAWGWRIPFLLSIILLAISVWIRMKLNESPLFQRMKAEGKHSKAPLTESFGNWSNAKIVIIALLGLTMGQAVVWYCGQFYALIFLTTTLKVDPITANILIATALAIGTPGFLLFGWWSDKIGRKPIIMAGCLIAAVSYFWVFGQLTHYANPALEKALQSSPVSVVADPADCSFQFKLVGNEKYLTSCDIATAALISRSVNYTVTAGPAGQPAVIKVGDKSITSHTGIGVPAADLKAKDTEFAKQLGEAIKAAGYPAKADESQMNKVAVVCLLVFLVILVTMVYGPIAAMLVELFPTRIRYTSMSLPYHIGNGWFGGLLPPFAVAIAAATGNIYNGLWYPIVIASVTFVIGLLLVPETKDRDIQNID